MSTYVKIDEKLTSSILTVNSWAGLCASLGVRFRMKKYARLVQRTVK